MKKQTAFRLNEELLRQLSELAQKENRSLNNYIETVLLHHIREKYDDKKR